MRDFQYSGCFRTRREPYDTEPMKRFDARFRIALAFLVTLGVLVLCFELGLFLWQDHLTDKFSRLDLVLTPIGLILGLVIGIVTGHWRFQALQGLAPRLSGKLLWREKTVLSRSELGQKALNVEQNSYAALFYLFLAVWGLTKAEFMSGLRSAFFVLGLCCSQTFPYFRFLWQRFSGAEESLEVPGEQIVLQAEAAGEQDEDALKDQEESDSKKRFDPRLRIAFILISVILCLVIGWSLPKERSLGTPGLLGVALILADVVAGLAVGAVIGRWRLLGLKKVSSQLGGRIVFLEPNILSGSAYGKRAIMTERIVIGIASLACIVWGALSKLFLSTDRCSNLLPLRSAAN